jgi:hypothetical protein
MSKEMDHILGLRGEETRASHGCGRRQLGVLHRGRVAVCAIVESSVRNVIMSVYP